jgi:hypothetical protein
MSKAEPCDPQSGQDEQSRSSELFTGVGSWMVCSVGMLVFNKLAAGVLPVCTLIALQFFFTVLVLLAGGWNTIHIGSRWDVLRWCRVVPFFTGMLLSSILALKYAPMTLVITFRALSPVVSMAIERFYPNPIRVSEFTLAAIGIMFAGMMIYMIGMDTTHLPGIGWAILNNFLAVTDRLLQRLMLAKDQDPVDISKSGATLLNNLLGVIPLAVTAVITEEWRELPAAIHDLTPLSIVWIVASCIVGAGISYTGIWAQSLISATSFLVLVNANKFLIIFLECWLAWQFHFGDKHPLTWTQVIGASISIIGGIAYGKARELVEREAETDYRALELSDKLDKEKLDTDNGAFSGEAPTAKLTQ